MLNESFMLIIIIFSSNKHLSIKTTFVINAIFQIIYFWIKVSPKDLKELIKDYLWCKDLNGELDKFYRLVVK